MTPNLLCGMLNIDFYTCPLCAYSDTNSHSRTEICAVCARQNGILTLLMLICSHRSQQDQPKEAAFSRQKVFNSNNKKNPKKMDHEGRKVMGSRVCIFIFSVLYCSV